MESKVKPPVTGSFAKEETRGPTASANDLIHSLTIALIREFLAKNKFQKTLETLYDEMGERPPPTTSSNVSRQLGLTKLVRQNKAKPAPLRTLAEVCVQNLVHKAAKQHKDEASGSSKANKSAKPYQERKRPKQRSHRASSSQGKMKAESGMQPLNLRPLKGVSSPTNKTLSDSDNFKEIDRGLVVEDFGDDLVDFEFLNISSSPAHMIDEPKYRRRPLSVDEAIGIRSLLFGPAEEPASLGRFHEPWMKQGICFIPDDSRKVSSLGYGLVQHHGGPCGVLAAVQAIILKELLFSGNDHQSTSAHVSQLNPPSEDRQRCLHLAICTIMWRAGSYRSCKVALPGNNTIEPRPFNTKRYVPDGFTETLDVFEVDSYEELSGLIRSNMSVFESRYGTGTILLLYSAMLSRGISHVRSDMDFEHATLIGAHGYCTQESVNLLLSGRAHSNVFDGDKQLDSMTLKGTRSRSDVGFLSLFEKFGHLEVGENLKRPVYPIWIVCSESHYTTLVGLDRRIVDVPHPDLAAFKRFDLFYYDQLANQDEEIRLSIDIDKRAPLPVDDMIPPLEDCLHTRWPGAHIHWNGVDPLL